MVADVREARGLMSRCEIAKQFIVADFLPARGLGWNRKPIDDLRVGFNLDHDNARFERRFCEVLLDPRVNVRHNCDRLCLMTVMAQKQGGKQQGENDSGCQRLRGPSSQPATVRVRLGHREDRFLALETGRG